MNNPAYESLAAVLKDAYDQASRGKGADRHAESDDHRFEDQPILTLQRLYGRGFAFGQVGKKMEETQRMDYSSARAELLGGIVYLAAAIIDLDRSEQLDQSGLGATCSACEGTGWEPFTRVDGRTLHRTCTKCVRQP